MKRTIKIALSVIIVIVMVSSFALAFSGCDKVKIPQIKMLDVPIVSEKEEYGFAIHKTNSTLLGYVNDLIAELKANKELDNIVTSFNNGTNDFTYSNPSETIPAGAKKLTVATDAESQPFEYTIANNVYSGIDIYIGYLLAQKLTQETGTPYYLFIRKINFENVLSGVANKEYDIGMASITITEERSKLVDFSNPYFETYQVLMTKYTDSTFKKIKATSNLDALLKTFDTSYIVGVRSFTTGQTIMSKYTNLTIKGFADYESAIDALINGEIKAVLLDVLYAKNLLNIYN